MDITARTKRFAPMFAQYPRAMVIELSTEKPQTRLLNRLSLDHQRPGGHVARQRYNALVRSGHGTDVIDLSRVESTPRSRSHVQGRTAASAKMLLYPGYASDDGHLNSRGSIRVAKVFLAGLAAG